MMMAEQPQPPLRRAVFAATLARLVGQQRFGALRRMPLFDRFAGRKAVQTLDPVLLAVLAIDRVGPAAVRVSAPDEVTAKVLRAALAQTASWRHTDRLIRIVVA